MPLDTSRKNYKYKRLEAFSLSDRHVTGIIENTMQRNFQLNRIKAAHDKQWDIIVIGGGATGLGVAVDSASRGYDTLLLEQSDFAKGTSSRSTKLVHGGVRYLAQGDVSLILEALHERGLFSASAGWVPKKLPRFSSKPADLDGPSTGTEK